jgi:hypothetical protein
VFGILCEREIGLEDQDSTQKRCEILSAGVNLLIRMSLSRNIPHPLCRNVKVKQIIVVFDNRTKFTTPRAAFFSRAM